MKKKRRPWYRRWWVLALGFIGVLVLGCGISMVVLVPEELIEAEESSEQFLTNYPNAVKTEKGIRFAELENPDGPTLFLIHGAPGHWQAWSRFLLDEELQAQFHLVAPDRPGYGGSAPGTAIGSMSEQADLLLKLAKGRPRPWIWAGHSFGVSIIARLAMDHPESVDGLVFAAGAMSPEYERKKWYHSFAEHSWVQPHLSEELDVSNKEAIAFEFEFDTMVPMWAQITAPTVIIHGREDWMADYRHVDFTLKEMVNAEIELITLEGAGHLIIWDHYEEVKEALLRFSREQ